MLYYMATQVALSLQILGCDLLFCTDLLPLSTLSTLSTQSKCLAVQVRPSKLLRRTCYKLFPDLGILMYRSIAIYTTAIYSSSGLIGLHRRYSTESSLKINKAYFVMECL